MRRKHSFATAFVAITMATMYHLQGVLLSFLVQEDDPTGLINLLPKPSSLQTETGAVAEKHTGIPQNVTIVCEMTGEMGNHLGHLAHCTGIALWLQRQHNVSSHLVLRLRRTWGVARWKAAQDAIRACFPKLKRYNFKEANTDEFPVWKKKLATLNLSLGDVNSRNATRFERAVHAFVNYSYTSHDPLPLQPQNSSISLPFLYSKAMASYDFVVDRYVDDIRVLFELAQSKGDCCSLKPDPDETVFHFRNFGTELPGRANKIGLQELGPKQTAQELFGHLNRGDKVAVISRFPLNHAIQYVDAFSERGLAVRFVQNQTGIQDFCFLMHAQKEMVGISFSTFFNWAALLSNASRIVAYSLDVPTQKRRTAYLKHFTFTNPELANRWTFPSFKPNESLFDERNP